MKISYVAHSQIPSRTANSIHVMRMCQAYSELGHKVTLVVPRWKHANEKDLGEIFSFYGVTRSFRIRRTRQVPRRLQTIYQGILLPLTASLSRPALIYTRSLAAAFGSSVILRRPTIFEAHHPLTHRPRPRFLFRRVMRSRCCRGLVVITHALAERLEPELPAGLRPIVAPDGVDQAWLDSSLSKKQARVNVGFEAWPGPIAVYTGHLYPGRGIELIIELASRCSEYLFLIVGGRRQEIKAYRGMAPGLENLHLLGFRPPGRVIEYLRAADVLLLPHSDQVTTVGGKEQAAYTSPMKLFEYLASGRPILASTLPVLQEVLEHERNALLLPYDQPERWVEALQRLRLHPGEAQRLSAQAARDARRYTWKARARSILEQALPAERFTGLDRSEEARR